MSDREESNIIDMMDKTGWKVHENRKNVIVFHLKHDVGSHIWVREYDKITGKFSVSIEKRMEKNI